MQRLYTQEDNARLNELMNTLEEKSAIMDRVSDILEGDAPSADTPFLSHDRLSALKPKQPVQVTFAHKGAHRFQWSLDKSALKPSSVVQMAGKGFAEAYLAQLNEILYHTKDEPAMDAMFDLMHLHDMTKRSSVIRVTSGRFVQRLPVIASTLTTFFNTNRHVIGAIATMVGNELTDQPT